MVVKMYNIDENRTALRYICVCMRSFVRIGIVLDIIAKKMCTIDDNNTALTYI